MPRRTSPQPIGAIDRRNRYYGQRYIEALVDLDRRAKHRLRKEHNRVGKKLAGRLLDGREWNDFPEVNYVGS